jgi:hypothetical protein
MIFTPWGSVKYGDLISFRHGSTRVIVESQKFIFKSHEFGIAYIGINKKPTFMSKHGMFLIYSIKRT